MNIDYDEKTWVWVCGCGTVDRDMRWDEMRWDEMRWDERREEWAKLEIVVKKAQFSEGCILISLSNALYWPSK